jgi:hypothetical protein
MLYTFVFRSCATTLVAKKFDPECDASGIREEEKLYIVNLYVKKKDYP